jgi:hypothetical protein
MPKRKELQLSGAKKRSLAKVKADKERCEVASAQRLDRFLVHSKLSDTESETVTCATMSMSEHCQPPESESEHSEAEFSEIVSQSNDDQAQGKRILRIHY